MNTLKINTTMKAIATLIIMALWIPASAMAENNLEGDTVIIELNKNSKIVIYTKSRDDLSALKNYDINQMIRDLNEQLSDTVNYLELNADEGKAYANDDEVNMDDWKINSDEVRIKLGGMQVDVDPDEVDDWDEDDWNDRKKVSYDADRVDRTTHHFNVDIGLNNWLDNKGKFPNETNEDHSVKPFGSWYVGLTSLNRTWVGGPLFLEWGLGLNWYNWKLENPDVLISEGPTQTNFTVVPNNISGQKSKLTATYINVQAVPMFDFSKGRQRVKSIESRGVRVKRYSRKGFRFGLGGYAGYRIGSHSKFVYKEDGKRDKDKDKDNFYLENFRYGLRAQVGWKGMEFFGTYDLNEVFSKGNGPALNAISFGITL
ncbi:MAG: hypothetical protein AB8B73_08685 [Ekhidna sp.]